MIRRFVIHGLIWLVLITFGVQLLTGWFSKPKRAISSSSISESDNPFKKDNSNGNSGNGKGNEKASEPTPVDPNQVILTGKLDHTVVEIQKCTGNGSELTIEGTLLNQGTDGVLRFYVGSYSYSTTMYDDYGNKIVANYMQIANLSANSSIDARLISGVPTRFSVRFQVPTVGGETQAHSVKVFQLVTDGFQAEFRNIKVDKVSKNSVIPTVTPNPISTPASTLNSTPTPETK